MQSITFTSVDGATSYNTLQDWYLVPNSRLFFTPPAPKTQYIDVPGASGSLDFSEVFGSVVYENSAGSWEFTIIAPLSQAWNTLIKKIIDFVHGKKLNIKVIENGKMIASGTGRFNIEYTPGEIHSQLTIGYNIEYSSIVIAS